VRRCSTRSLLPLLGITVEDAADGGDGGSSRGCVGEQSSQRGLPAIPRCDRRLLETAAIVELLASAPTTLAEAVDITIAYCARARGGHLRAHDRHQARRRV